MLPPFLGMLLFLGTVVVVGLAGVIALGAAIAGNTALRRLALRGGAMMAGGYAVFWLLGVLLPTTEVLPPGEALRFCGLDCHLHVSVAGIRPGPDLGVTVSFSSSARDTPEFPAELKFRLRDAAGREYAPMNAISAAPLAAGSSSTLELRFPGGVPAPGASLVVTWNGWLDYFVPGQGNPLAQRRHRLALPPAGV